jgi:TolB-like protein/Tfp pilus assembly protein PilF
VAARSSSFRFKGQDDAVQRIARELHVETVLEGTLRRAGDRSRITVQLVDVSDGCHLWSERYDFVQADVFAVQEEIATRVVEALRLRLGGAPALERPSSLDAYHLYLKGRYRWNQRHAGGLRDAVASFEQAIELDPGYAAAWAGLAQTYAMLGLSLYDAMPTAEAMPRAKAAALRALELEPGRADAHAVLGWARFHHDWDWQAAERDFQRAVELDPRHATTRHWYSFLLSLTGRYDEARRQALAAWENDPLSLIVNSNLSQPEYYARHWNQAFDAARKVVELDPRFAVAHSWLGLVLLERGEHDAAIAAFETFGECFGATSRSLALIGHAHGRAGRRVEAREALAELRRRHELRPVPAYHLAIVHVGLGEHDEALRWLEAAADEHSDAIAYLAVDPLLDPLRRDPRFAHLLERSGLARVAARAIPPPPTTAEPSVGPRTARRSVAVLPFRDLAGDPASAHLRLGLADATITELARERTLLVRPTSAILRFQDGPVDAASAARTLGVDSVIDGSFVRAGGRIRVTAQLVSAADGSSSWGTRVEGGSDDLFALQDELARQVLGALLPARPAIRGVARTVAPAGRAYDLYLQGRSKLLRESLAGFVEAIDLFERARAADPGFALAAAGLADTYARLGFQFQPEGDWHARGVAMCEEALRLDPDLPEGLYARGRLRWTPHSGWDHEGALRDFHAAIVARPGFDEAHLRLGTVLFHVGLIEEGEHHLEQALVISPGHDTAINQLALCRYHQRRFVEALEPSLEGARTMSVPWARYQAALCLLRLDRWDEAEEMAGLIDSEIPGHELAAAIHGLASARRGDLETARRHGASIAAHPEVFGHHHHAQYDLACIHALLGEADAAVTQLEAAAGNGYPCGPFFAADPLLGGLHGSAGFDALLARLGEQRSVYLALYESLRRSDSPTAPPRT